MELKLLIVHSVGRRVLDIRIVGFDGVRSSKHDHSKNIFFIGSFLGICDSVGLGRVAIYLKLISLVFVILALRSIVSRINNLAT